MDCNITSPFLLSYVLREIVTDNFDALYALLKPKGVTVSAMLAKAVAEVLKKHPIINAAYVEGGIKYNKGIYYALLLYLSLLVCEREGVCVSISSL